MLRTPQYVCPANHRRLALPPLRAMDVTSPHDEGVGRGSGSTAVELGKFPRETRRFLPLLPRGRRGLGRGGPNECFKDQLPWGRGEWAAGLTLPAKNTDGHGLAAYCRAGSPHPQGQRLRRGLPQGLSVSICGFIVSTAGFRIMGIAALLTLAMPLPQRIEHTSVVPPLYVRSTSVPPPSVIQRYYGGTSDVQRRYYGGTKHVVTAVGGQQFSL